MSSLKIVIRNKYTKIYYDIESAEPCKFVTLDISKATQFENTKSLRDEFNRHFPGQIEFCEIK